MSPRGAAAVVAAAVLVSSAACGRQPLSPEAERGRQIYQSQCIACHNPDPAQAGAVGPALKGSSRALLEPKVLKGGYPPGYTPKRPTKVMQPMPQLAGDIGALSEYLK